MSVLDSNTLRVWMRASLDALGDKRAEIDALNVFPVPDGDTGTNLFLTVEAASEATDDVGDHPAPGPMAEAIAHGALLGARGNSGVILSQLLRGLADEFKNVESATGTTLAAGLTRASRLAYAAVSRPQEGTLLTVARVAAERATAQLGSVVEVATAAADGAREALAKTPEQLEVLAAAGVVDAGGKGWVVVLDALVEVLSGVRQPHHHTVRPKIVAHEPLAAEDYDGPRYEVMYLLDANDDHIPQLRTTLDGLGDSLVVVGGGGLWNVHVHTDTIGAAIEAGIESGRPYRLAITDLIEQQRTRTPVRSRVVVGVAHGAGVVTLLQESGALPVKAPPRGRPSTQEFVKAVQASGATEAILLPSDHDSTPVARAAAEYLRDHDIRVAVVPSRSVVQTLSALAVHDAMADFDDDVVTMARASSSTRYGGVTIASREAYTAAGKCQIGDVLGLVDGDIVEIGDSLVDVTLALIERMRAASTELVTLVLGSDAPEGLADTVTEFVAPHSIDTEVVDGQQPYWPVILGVE